MAITKGSDLLRQNFERYAIEKYKGKVHRLERMYDPRFSDVRVLVEFRIPEHKADEIEIYRRINKVIHVIAEGDDEG